MKSGAVVDKVFWSVVVGLSRGVPEIAKLPRGLFAGSAGDSSLDSG